MSGHLHISYTEDVLNVTYDPDNILTHTYTYLSPSVDEARWLDKISRNGNDGLDKPKWYKTLDGLWSVQLKFIQVLQTKVPIYVQ